MRTSITRVIVASAAAVALSGLAPTTASAAGPAGPHARTPARTVHGATAVPGARLWLQRYNSFSKYPQRSVDVGRSVAVSPDGSVVYVTGYRHAFGGSDYATIAYNARTGARLWIARYNGTGNGSDQAVTVAVSPDGSTVYVTGSSAGTGSNDDYATIAYHAATGAQQWVSRYNGPGNFADEATKLVVSPDGTALFVTGFSYGGATSYDYATVGYDAATGAQQWVSRYDGPAGSSDDTATSETVSPSGDTVFVTGSSNGPGSGNDYATVGYDAATGAQQWVSRYDGPASQGDLAHSVAVSPDGSTVFVTGASGDAGSAEDYATVAYNAATGAQEWAQCYSGAPNSVNAAFSVAASPGGGSVFVTGVSDGTSSGADYATIAYNGTTGAKQWVKRYNGPGNSEDNADAVTVSPTGSTVYVTGYSFGTGTAPDYATVAYSAANGAQQWARRYNGPGNGQDEGDSVAVSPSGSTVFVTGYSTGAGTNFDYTTIAYNG